jgi:chromosomal replication initiator protein
MQTSQKDLIDDRNDIESASRGTCLEEARDCDFLIVEDLQRLPIEASESLVQVMDCLKDSGRKVIITANAGPQRLRHNGEPFPSRLTSRLSAGLVIGLAPLAASSRLLLLQTLAQRRQLAVPTEVLRWLADRLTGGGRQLEGALTRLEALIKVHGRTLDLGMVEAQFKEETEAGTVTVERIANIVSGYFHVDVRDLQSDRRCHHVLLPRQVGMYLARLLTALSLEGIGQFFGGRDHSTVLHACRKMEKTLHRDALLSGAVREIHASLA